MYTVYQLFICPPLFKITFFMWAVKEAKQLKINFLHSSELKSSWASSKSSSCVVITYCILNNYSCIQDHTLSIGLRSGEFGGHFSTFTFYSARYYFVSADTWERVGIIMLKNMHLSIKIRMRKEAIIEYFCILLAIKCTIFHSIYQTSFTPPCLLIIPQTITCNPPWNLASSLINLLSFQLSPSRLRTYVAFSTFLWK